MCNTDEENNDRGSVIALRGEALADSKWLLINKNYGSTANRGRYNAVILIESSNDIKRLDIERISTTRRRRKNYFVRVCAEFKGSFNAARGHSQGKFEKNTHKERKHKTRAVRRREGLVSWISLNEFTVSIAKMWLTSFIALSHSRAYFLFFFYLHSLLFCLGQNKVRRFVIVEKASRYFCFI